MQISWRYASKRLDLISIGELILNFLLELRRIKIVDSSSFLVPRCCNPYVLPVEKASSIQKIKLGSLWELNESNCFISGCDYSWVVSIGLLIGTT